MHESKVPANGRITLPKSVREALGLQPGDRIRYFIMDGHVQIRKVRHISELAGILKYDGPPVTLEDMDNAVRDAAAERYLRH